MKVSKEYLRERVYDVPNYHIQAEAADKARNERLEEFRAAGHEVLGDSVLMRETA